MFTAPLSLDLIGPNYLQNRTSLLDALLIILNVMHDCLYSALDFNPFISCPAYIFILSSVYIHQI